MAEQQQQNEHRRATAAELIGMSKYLGVRCNSEDVAYMGCKEKYNHPEDCIEESKAVLNLIEMLDKAPKEFRDYCDCLDYYTLDMKKCRKEGKELEKAVPLAEQ